MVSNLRVVIAAGGQGRRMGEAINKQYLLLENRPVLAYALDFFDQLDCVDQIVVVAAANEIELCYRDVIDRYGYRKVGAVVEGGRERQDSVWAGLRSLPRDTDYVAVHDGARPILSRRVLIELLKAAEAWGAAIPGVPSRETVKMVDRDGFVKRTLQRSSVYTIQTPQVFKYSELYAAYEQALEEKFTGTDDASLFERYIGMVKVVEGDYANIKITAPNDLILVRSLLEQRKDAD